LAKSIALAVLHQGLVRRYNEDNLYILDHYVQAAQSLNFEKSTVSSNNPQFYAVADGTGGMGIGDAASRTAMWALDQQQRALRQGRFDFEPFARDTVNLANRTVCDQLAPYEGLRVGTTFSLLVIDQNAAYTISLGNSRIYLFRSGQLHRLTEDHLSRMPDHHQLTRHLGFLTDAAMTESENMTRTVLNPGDILLLTTDGVTNNLDDGLITRELMAPAAFVQIIHHLRTLVLQTGGQDNFALIAVKILDPQAAGPEPSKHEHSRLPGRPKARRTRAYYGPKIRGHAGIGQNGPAPRWLRPLLFFLLFVILGIVLGRFLFSLPSLLDRLMAFG
jgi:PPM family protein phosphatase